MQPIWKKVLRAVREAVGRLSGDDTGVQKIGEIAVEGDLSQADDDTNARQGLDLTCQVVSAVANLLRCRFITWGSAMDDRRDPRMAKLETVITGGRFGLAGKAQFMQDGVHKVAGTVSGEGTAGTIGTVGSRGKAEDENAGTGVSESGDGAGPVGLILIGAATSFSDSAAIVAKPRTKLAIDDGFANLLQTWRQEINLGATHCIS